ncbi:hypothetical protein KL909_005361 [Ogataea angusta]|nr:hypothetical protein KL909_005361 [Ogataea angusta]
MTDELVSALVELSKAASDASKATFLFFNALENNNTDRSLFEDLMVPIVGHDSVPMLANMGNHDKKEEKKRKRAPKDPNAPKKPLTSFFLYSNAMRDIIVKERMLSGESSLSQPEIAQETSRRWKELSESEKAKWKELYEEQKAMYEEENKKYLLAKETGAAYTAPKKPETAPTPSSLKKSDHEKKKEKKKKKKEKQQQQQQQLLMSE